MSLLIDDLSKLLPEDHGNASLVGRVWTAAGPSIVRVTAGSIYDITQHAPTLAALINREDAASFLISLPDSDTLSSFEAVAKNTLDENRNPRLPYFISPLDLQPVKACGVTFHDSLVERIIEERTEGNKALAQRVRTELIEKLGRDFESVMPGSAEALELLALLKRENLWSQYLEVGLGTDAEIFTKATPLASVGTGSEIGILPISDWNNPEPELTLVINRFGNIVGATLGNDVNHRDIEGRSALLLGRAKDNNAACALGPFVRLLDTSFTFENLSQLAIKLTVEGKDGFKLQDENTVANIRRDINEIVGQCVGSYNAYPDGVALMLGAMSSPTQDRDEKGKGFTHKPGDIVQISSPGLGTLVNRVSYTDQLEPWRFGIGELMQNLSSRKLI